MGRLVSPPSERKTRRDILLMLLTAWVAGLSAGCLVLGAAL